MVEGFESLGMFFHLLEVSTVLSMSIQWSSSLGKITNMFSVVIHKFQEGEKLFGSGKLRSKHKFLIFSRIHGNFLGRNHSPYESYFLLEKLAFMRLKFQFAFLGHSIIFKQARFGNDSSLLLVLLSNFNLPIP